MTLTSVPGSTHGLSGSPASLLAGKSAIVTGGASGIGQAIARLFAREGAKVAVLDVAPTDETVTSILESGATAMAVACDVTRQGDVAEAFEIAEARYGPVDILVNSAGVAHVGTIETTTEEALDRVYAVNVKGMFNCMQAAVRVMKDRGGAILNLSSVAATVGIPDRFAYSMSKGAVLSMTYSVARDYVGQKVRCNCIAPGRVHTPFVDGFLATSYPGREAEMFDLLSRSQPIGRMGTSEEIAQLALFLCSDSASFITGSNYAIDGGFVSLKM